MLPLGLLDDWKTEATEIPRESVALAGSRGCTGSDKGWVGKEIKSSIAQVLLLGKFEKPGSMAWGFLGILDAAHSHSL